MSNRQHRTVFEFICNDILNQTIIFDIDISSRFIYQYNFAIF